MECNELRETLVQYTLDELGSDEKASIEKQINNCDCCRDYVSESVGLWSFLETWDELEPNRNYISNFWNKVEETQPAPGFLNWIRNIKPNWTMAGAMASIFLVSVITFGAFSPEMRNNIFMSSDERIELVMLELDNALSRETSDVLSIYGPWDGGPEINNGGNN